MRHKRPNPLVGTARRLRRRAAAALEPVTGYRPGAAVTAVVVTLAVGCGGYVALESGSEPPTRAIDPMSPPDSEPTAAPTGAVQTSPSDARPAPAPSAAGPSGSAGPVAPTGVVDPTRSEDGPEEQTDAPEPPPTSTASDPPSEPPSGTPSGDRYEVVPDTRPPRTTLTVERPAPDSARLTFGADELALFTCTLDGDAFMPCASPRVLVGLEPGWHTFTVFAVDSAGNADSSPAQARWHVGAELEGR